MTELKSKEERYCRHNNHSNVGLFGGVRHIALENEYDPVASINYFESIIGFCVLIIILSSSYLPLFPCFYQVESKG